jgi:hypothetical protein
MLTIYTSGIGYVNAQQAARLADNEGQGGQESEQRESSDKRRRLLVQQVRGKKGGKKRRAKNKKRRRLLQQAQQRGVSRRDTPAYVSIRQHTSAYVSIRQHTSAYERWRRVAQQRVSHAAHARHAICGMRSADWVQHPRMRARRCRTPPQKKAA